MKTPTPGWKTPFFLEKTPFLKRKTAFSDGENGVFSPRIRRFSIRKTAFSDSETPKALIDNALPNSLYFA